MKPRTTALVALGSLALLLAAPLSAQTRPNPRWAERFRRVALPQFHDTLGWRQPMYYSTIQTADVDGDGQSELLARWIDGLHAYRFHNGTWLRHSRLEALSDNEGFTNPTWYSSIHTAVLDARLGQADVIARKADGIHVYRYDRSGQRWVELGASVRTRPFADFSPADASTAASLIPYSSLRAADLTRDGSAELIGLGPNGVEVYAWNASSESWTSVATNRILTPQEGFQASVHGSSLQVIDLERDGAAELLAVGTNGLQTHRWTANGWSAGSGEGLFRMGDAPNSRPSTRSVRAAVDANGTAWLAGIVQGSGGPNSGAIQVHQWRDGRWQPSRTITLPGRGWNEDSQSGTLMVADVQGNPVPELLVRSSTGLHLFTMDGHSLPVHSQSFTDAQGWNLPQHHQTIGSVSVRVTQGGTTAARTLVFGRGKSGIEMYRFQPDITGGAWVAGTVSGFVNFCADPNTDQCKSYQALSQLAGRTNDLRSRYGEDADNAAIWLANFPSTAPAGVSQTAFDEVREQLRQELNYLHTVHVWFGNNTKVMSYMYAQSANSLNDIYQKVTLGDAGANSAQMVVKWVAFALNIVGEIAGVFVGEELSVVTGILSEVMDKTAEATEKEDGGEEVRKTYGELSKKVNEQQDDFTEQNALVKSEYLTNWDKLQQIGADSETGKYSWATETPDTLAKAQLNASRGLRKWAYKPLASASWHVWACFNADFPFGGCSPRDNYPRFQEFACAYNYTYRADESNARWSYVVKRNWSYPDVDALQEITGTGPNDLNISYFPFVLAGMDDWDLEASDEVMRDQITRFGPSFLSPESQGNTPGCFGGGSRAGIKEASGSTVTERLTAAHMNYKLIYAGGASDILRSLRSLRQAAGQLSPNSTIRLQLDAPLREAIDTLRLVREPLSPEQRSPSVRRSVPAGRPARMLQSFLMRVEGSTDELGQRAADELNAQAHRLLAQLDVPDPNAPPPAGR